MWFSFRKHQLNMTLQELTEQTAVFNTFDFLQKQETIRSVNSRDQQKLISPV